MGQKFLAPADGTAVHHMRGHPFMSPGGAGMVSWREFPRKGGGLQECSDCPFSGRFGSIIVSLDVRESLITSFLGSLIRQSLWRRPWNLVARTLCDILCWAWAVSHIGKKNSITSYSDRPRLPGMRQFASKLNTEWLSSHKHWSSLRSVAFCRNTGRRRCLILCVYVNNPWCLTWIRTASWGPTIYYWNEVRSSSSAVVHCG